MTSEGNQQRVTYEVSIPAESEDQLLALKGLAKVYEWGLRERPVEGTPIPIYSDEIISRHSLLEASNDLFGSDRYGITAYTLLERQRREATMITWNFHNKPEVYASSVNSGRSKYLPEVIAYTSDTKEEIKEKLLAAANASYLPFDFESDEVIYRGNTKKPGVKPLREIRRARLANYMTGRGLKGHELQGLLGKAFDVLNNVAGTAEPKATEPYNPEQFMQIKKMEAWAKDKGVTVSMLGTIKNKLGRALMYQVETGKPAEGGEVIVEEYLDANRDYIIDLSGREAISTASLVGLSNVLRTNSKSGSFLASIPRLLEEDRRQVASSQT